MSASSLPDRAAEKAEATFRETLLAVDDEHARACLLAAADSWCRAATRAALKALHDELVARHQDLGVSG